MAPDYKIGWEQFVCHMLSQVSYLDEVKVNQPQVAGKMFADGWRKCSVQESFGRYTSVNSLAKKMNVLEYNPIDQKKCIQEAGDWLGSQQKEFAPEVFKDFQAILVENSLPSYS